MAKQMVRPDVPNLKFSHMGLSVRNVARMEDFYTRILGFTVTDRAFLRSAAWLGELM